VFEIGVALAAPFSLYLGMQKFYPINGLSSYSISREGQVYSHLTNRIMKPYLGKNGYYVFDLSNPGARMFNLHRLLAETFIPNQENKCDVNHINGIKTDNRLENLEWATRSENVKHAHQLGLRTITDKNREATSKSNSKPIIDLWTGVVFDSLKLACEALNMSYSPTALRISRKREKRLLYI
jgi:hypothetical protein